MMQSRERWNQRRVPQHLLHGGCDEIGLCAHRRSLRVCIHQHTCLGWARAFLTAGKTVGESFLAEQQLPSDNISCGEESSSSTLGAFDGNRCSVRCVVKVRWSFPGRVVHGLEVVFACFLLTESLLRPQQLLSSLRVVRVGFQKATESLAAFLKSL